MIGATHLHRRDYPFPRLGILLILRGCSANFPQCDIVWGKVKINKAVEKRGNSCRGRYRFFFAVSFLCPATGCSHETALMYRNSSTDIFQRHHCGIRSEKLLFRLETSARAPFENDRLKNYPQPQGGRRRKKGRRKLQACFAEIRRDYLEVGGARKDRRRPSLIFAQGTARVPLRIFTGVA